MNSIIENKHITFDYINISSGVILLIKPLTVSHFDHMKKLSYTLDKIVIYEIDYILRAYYDHTIYKIDIIDGIYCLVSRNKILLNEISVTKQLPTMVNCGTLKCACLGNLIVKMCNDVMKVYAKLDSGTLSPILYTDLIKCRDKKLLVDYSSKYVGNTFNIKVHYKINKRLVIDPVFGTMFYPNDEPIIEVMECVSKITYKIFQGTPTFEKEIISFLNTQVNIIVKHSKDTWLDVELIEITDI